MKFLLDVNVSRATGQWLGELGHEAISVADTDCRMPDDQILAWAVREGCVLITSDLDFEEMIWRENRPHRGVLRLENLPRVARRRLLSATLATCEQALAEGAIVIATRRHIRIRQPK